MPDPERRVGLPIPGVSARQIGLSHTRTGTKSHQVGNASTLRCDGCVPLALPVQPVTPLPPNPALAEPVALGKSVRFQTVHTGMHLPFAAVSLATATWGDYRSPINVQGE